MLTPLLLIGVTGWWLRTLLRETIEDHQSLWPLGAVLISILIIMAVMSAVAVVKEEQYNLITVSIINHTNIIKFLYYGWSARAELDRIQDSI